MAARSRSGAWSLAPWLTVGVLLLPVVAGLIGTLLPAFGVLPSLVGAEPGLGAWRALFAAPGFATALQSTVIIGVTVTVLSLALAIAAVAFAFHRPWGRRLGEAMAPMLAMPHAALAIGFAFLVAPSGWLVRWVSPALTGWDVPPDVATVGHPSGWPMMAALLLKEVPYLVLVTLAALAQVPARAQLAVARSFGYAPAAAWLAVVLPQVYRQIRLPVLAVLAYSLSVVDVALILGPHNPPTLAVLAVRWFADPDLRNVLPAAAASVLLLGVVVTAIALWCVGERGVAAIWKRHVERGARGPGAGIAVAAGSAVGAALLLLAVLAMLGMALWTFAAQWRYPNAWPTGWTLGTWQRQSASLWTPAWTTLAIGVASVVIGLALVLGCLEHETGGRAVRPAAGPPANSRATMLLYVPLIVPQIAFLFGLQVLLVRLDLDGRFAAVVWAHLVFVLPYLFLALADPWRALDPRYARAAASLGASRWRVFWRVKLPILMRPVLGACAIAFAVSVGQYLPTLFAGNGRVATLTTEAVTLSSGADRRVIGTWATLQAAFPLLAFLAATAIPRLVHTRRRGLA